MEGPSLVTGADPRALPLGTRLGPWRVVGYGGVGVYGAVYRAVRDEHEDAEPVALKLALCPRDPRFEREAELLARIRHPSVPRLVDAGQWRHSSGFMHPYVVMEWVAGEPLYAWASRRNPSSRQVLQLLARGAWALQATHAVKAVHRDVKGDNSLVRVADGQLFLVDFGSGHYAGAERLTPSPLPPSTPAYRSPQAWDYARHHGHQPFALYVARPADDVFAFGVMAYRLVTDEYPPLADSRREEGRCWLPGGEGPRPPRVLNARVVRRLDALILRMLSVNAEERPTADELAQSLEQQAAQSGADADAPLFEWETLARSEWSPEEVAASGFRGHRLRRRAPEEVRLTGEVEATARKRAEHLKVQAPIRAAVLISRRAPRERLGRWLPGLVLASVGAVVLWSQRTVTDRVEEKPTVARISPDTGGQDGGSVSVGDSAPASVSAPMKAPSAASPKGVLAVEQLPEPVPGQLKPDSNGRCRKGQVAINGGCWLEVKVSLDDCSGNGVVYKGGCYTPFIPLSREPTSSPAR